MSKAIIELEKVSKTFPKAPKPSVCETSLSIEEGSFVTILGTSGSGKTTLLKMINRLHEPSSGRIFVQGEDIAKMPVTHLRRRIGYVIQQIGLFPHMTVKENIAMVPRILKWDEEQISQRVDFLLQLVHLPPEDFRNRYPRQLSGGQQQRVGIARALASDPDILLMDEPFGAIDAITRSSLQDELLAIQRKMRKTILFVTHDIEEALKLGDKIIVMHDGRVQQYDTPINILMNPANEFVRRLINTEDLFRLLSLFKVEKAMVPVHETMVEDRDARVSPETDLKTVLALLLNRDIEKVIVVDEQDKPLGQIGFAQVKHFVRLKQKDAQSFYSINR